MSELLDFLDSAINEYALSKTDALEKEAVENIEKEYYNKGYTEGKSVAIKELEDLIKQVRRSIHRNQDAIDYLESILEYLKTK